MLLLGGLLMKKFFAALSLFALMNFSTCAAASVQAVGRGVNERMAIHDALRTAIEQNFGAVVHSKTLADNYALVLDKNSVDSAGIVSSWEILSRRVENGIFVVTIRAELDEKISSRLTERDKKALVDFNAENPRVAVVAVDSNGRRCPEVENEIISALKWQGFTRTVDANHADFLVAAEVKNFSGEVTIASRLIAHNTGEIIFAGTSSGGRDFLSEGDLLKFTGRRIANELSNAALKSAAQIERHVTLIITPQTFEQLGGTLTAVRSRVKNISGVNDAFVRRLNAGLELDVDFDGTAADFAQLLETCAIKILELGAGYIKI